MILTCDKQTKNSGFLSFRVKTVEALKRLRYNNLSEIQCVERV